MIVYVSNIDTTFSGGASNLHEYVIKKFSFINLDSDIKYVNSEVWEDEDSFNKIMQDLKPDKILIESSTYESTRRLYNSLTNYKQDLSGIYIYMHSPILQCEDIHMEDDMSPSLLDLRDLGIYRQLAKLGVKFLYASANVAFMSEQIIGHGEVLPTENFYSANTNKVFLKSERNKVTIDIKPKERNNKVLYTNAYYHPAAGNLAVMEAIKKSNLHEFEWYLVGNIFDDIRTDKECRLWTEHYKDVLERPDVHLEGFKRGYDEIRPYFESCYFNLITCVGDSYSFKALEAISYGCLNVTPVQQSYLPWVSEAQTYEAGDSLDEFSSNLLNALRNPTKGTPDINLSLLKLKLGTYENEYQIVDMVVCFKYISWFFSKICKISYPILNKYLPSIFNDEDCFNRI